MLPERLYRQNIEQLDKVRGDWEQEHRTTCEVSLTPSAQDVRHGEAPAQPPSQASCPLFAKAQTSVVCGLELSLVHTRDELGASLEGTEASGWGPVTLPGHPRASHGVYGSGTLGAPQPFFLDS